MRALRSQDGEGHLALGVIADELALFLFGLHLVFVVQRYLVFLEKLFVGLVTGSSHDAFDVVLEALQVLRDVYHRTLLQLIELVQSLRTVLLHVQQVPLGYDEVFAQQVL